MGRYPDQNRLAACKEPGAPSEYQTEATQCPELQSERFEVREVNFDNRLDGSAGDPIYR